MSNDNVPLGKAIEEFLASSHARVGMRVDLMGFTRKCGADCPLFLAAGEVKGFMTGVKKAAERKRRADTLEAFFDFAKEKGWVTVNPAVGLIKKKEPVVKKKIVVPKREPVRLSVEGRQTIEAEMEQLREEKERVIQDVKDAREDGDLKENAPYHAARERLAMIEGRLREGEDILARAIPLE